MSEYPLPRGLESHQPTLSWKRGPFSSAYFSTPHKDGSLYQTGRLAAQETANLNLENRAFAYNELAMLVMMYNYNSEWSLRADKNRYNYTQLYGYGMYVELGTMDPSRDVKFSKILALIHHMKRGHHQWFWMLDADAVITDFHVKAHHIIRDAVAGNSNVEMIIGQDCNGFNSRSYFIKSSPWSINFLESAYTHHTTKFKDQECLFREMYARSEPGLRVKEVPIATLQSYGTSDCGNEWEAGKFVIHYPGVWDGESWFIKDINAKMDLGYASLLAARDAP